MPFTEGTSVTFPTKSGDFTIGTVKAFKDGKYQVEVEGAKILQVEEVDVKEFSIPIQRRDIFDTLK